MRILSGIFCSGGVFFLIGEVGVEERIVDFFDWGMELTEEMRILCGKICGCFNFYYKFLL